MGNDLFCHNNGQQVEKSHTGKLIYIHIYIPIYVTTAMFSIQCSSESEPKIFQTLLRI